MKRRPMAHICLFLYCLSGLLGRAGFVLCTEEQGTQSVELAALLCCKSLAGEASELGHDDSSAIKDLESCSGCADVPLARILNHLDSRPAFVPAPDALAAAMVQPRMDSSLIGRRIVWRALNPRRDLPGAGSTPQVRRN